LGFVRQELRFRKLEGKKSVSNERFYNLEVQGKGCCKGNADWVKKAEWEGKGRNSVEKRFRQVRGLKIMICPALKTAIVWFMEGAKGREKKRKPQGKESELGEVKEKRITRKGLEG